MSDDDIPTQQTDDSSTTDATEAAVDGGTVATEAPQSRFWGAVPSGWELVEGSEVYDVNPSYTPEEEEITYIEMDALDTELPFPKYSKKRKAADYSGKLFREGDILFSRITPCTENGKTAFVNEMETDVGIGSTEYAVLSPDRERIHPLFLYYVAKSHPVRNYAISRMRGSTGRQRVPFDVFRRELDIALPPLEEQQRIVTILHNIDMALRKSQSIINKIERCKTAAIRELYDGEKPIATATEVSDDSVPEGWTVEPLENIISMSGGNTPSKKDGSYWRGDTPWVSPKDFSGPEIETTEDWLTEKGVEKSTSNILAAGTIVLVVRSGILRRHLPVAKLASPAVINQDIKALVPNDDRVNPEFLFQILHTLSERVRGRCTKTGTTVESIQTSVLERYPIKIPPREEQERIVSIGTTYDELMKNEKTNLEQVKTLKKGLIQDLLQGSVRTSEDIHILEAVKNV